MGIGGRKTPLPLWYCGLEKGTAISRSEGEAQHFTDELFGNGIGTLTLDYAGAVHAARALPSAVGDRMTVAMKAPSSCTRRERETIGRSVRRAHLIHICPAAAAGNGNANAGGAA